MPGCSLVGVSPCMATTSIPTTTVLPAPPTLAPVTRHLLLREVTTKPAVVQTMDITPTLEVKLTAMGRQHQLLHQGNMVPPRAPLQSYNSWLIVWTILDFQPRLLGAYLIILYNPQHQAPTQPAVPVVVNPPTHLPKTQFRQLDYPPHLHIHHILLLIADPQIVPAQLEEVLGPPIQLSQPPTVPVRPAATTLQQQLA